MSTSIQEALGLPLLEDLLKTSSPTASEDAPLDANDEEVSEDVENMPIVVPSQSSGPVAPHEEPHETEQARIHEQNMDTIYDETIQHSRDLMDLGYNVDTRSAGRIFETAATMYKMALDAANAKRDAQLKLLKLKQEQLKLEAALKNNNGNTTSSNGNVVEAESVIVEDRNALLARLRGEEPK